MAVDNKKRNRIIINFRDTKEEMELYEKFLKHSNPASYIKDVFMGLIPLTLESNIKVIQNTTECVKKETETKKEILDIDNILEIIND